MFFPSRKCNRYIWAWGGWQNEVCIVCSWPYFTVFYGSIDSYWWDWSVLKEEGQGWTGPTVAVSALCQNSALWECSRARRRPSCPCRSFYWSNHREACCENWEREFSLKPLGTTPEKSLVKDFGVALQCFWSSQPLISLKLLVLSKFLWDLFSCVLEFLHLSWLVLSLEPVLNTCENCCCM